MAWPNDPLPVKIEIYLGSTLGWTDITNYVLVRDGIRIQRGFQDETTWPEPSSMELTLNNKDGRFSPRNATGPYYGLIGRNTPIRVSIALYQDAFDRTVSDGWGEDWTLVTTGGSADDFDVAGGVGTIVVDDDAEFRAVYLTNRSYRNVEVRATVGIDDLVDVTGDTAGIGLVLRVTDADNLYWAVATVNTDESITVTIYNREGGTNTALDSTVTDLTWDGTPLRLAFAAHGTKLRAKVWPSDEPEPDEWTIETTDDTRTSGSVGARASVRAGNTDVPITFTVDDFEVRTYRFHGEISEWPTRWDLSGTDVWTSITAQGILRRLQQGRTPQLSTIRQYMAGQTANLRAYWPMEDDSLQNLVSSGLPGVEVVSGATAHFERGGPLGSNGAVLVSAPSSVVNENEEYIGTLRLPVAPYLPASGSLTVGFMLRQDRPAELISQTGRAPVGGTINVVTDGTVGVLTFTWRSDPDGIVGTTVVDFGTTFPNVATASVDLADGEWHTVVGIVQTSGSDLNLFLYIDGQLVDSASISSVAIGRVLDLNDFGSSYFHPDLLINKPWSFDIAHIAVWDETRTYPPVLVMNGYSGEQAHERAERVLTFAGVPVTIIGSESMTLGPQPVGKPLEIATEAAAADVGLQLFESRDELGITFRCRTTLYNQDPALTLDYEARGEVAPDLEPTDDDQGLRNRVIVKRKRDGAESAPAELTSGRLSTQDPPDGVGVYDEELTLNVSDDVNLDDVASWRLHVGTWDEPRIPEVPLDLTAMAAAGRLDLVAAAAALDVGDRVQITNLPVYSGFVGTADLMTLGFREVIGVFAWRIRI